MIEVVATPGDCPNTHARVRQLMAAAGADLTWLDATRPGVRVLAGHRRWRGAGLPPAVLAREALGVFAQHRPIRPLPGLRMRHADVDVLVVRETTEDVYAHLEHTSIPGVFESLKVTTRTACERIARHAFEQARLQGRSRVTVVHKANILKKSDGLFLGVAREIAAEYADLTCDDIIVDALCMRLVLDPARFDVLLCGNLYGDIVGDLCAGLVGGASNAPTVEFAMDGTVLFSAGHGDAPEADGTERANPLPVLLPAIHLLRHADLDGEADRLHGATAATLESGVVPIGAGGTATFDAFCEALEARISSAD